MSRSVTNPRHPQQADRVRGNPGRTLARALPKLGFCSRSRAIELILAGRVQINSTQCRDPGRTVDICRDQLSVDGLPVQAAGKVYLMLNKPRALITTASDEQQRGIVFDCLPSNLSYLSPVGRLDKASEGLLLFTNDTQWAAALTDPQRHVDKTYHVQISRLAEAGLINRLQLGVEDGGERLRAKRATILRQGARTCWLELVLDEGKNRHIRRMLAAVKAGVLRLVRVAIGPLQLGTLPKGGYRFLTKAEVAKLQAPFGS